MPFFFNSFDTVKLQSLRFQNVRNHRETLVTDLAQGINVFVGENGAGKTSVLEALSFSTITKSFTTHSDTVLIRNGESSLAVDARFESDLGVPHHVSVTLNSGPPAKKIISANNELLRSAADLIGRAPVVVLTPDDKVITGGAPQERRRFLNMVLSQATRSYLEDELEFKRALKQRNSILNDAKLQRRSLGYIKPFLEPWSELLVSHGARIMRKRAAFVKEFIPYLLKSYSMVSREREHPALRYLPMGLELPDDSDYASMLQEKQAELESDEIRRGTTLFGPHRDELMIFVNPNNEAKLYASQGQHKTLLVSMKLAEYDYLKEASGETPILLLDDVFSELDRSRAHELLELLRSNLSGQTFISSTSEDVFEHILETGTHNQLYHVKRSSDQTATLERRTSQQS